MHIPQGGIGACKAPEQLLDNLTVHNATSTKELLARFASLEEEILQRNQIAAASSSGDKYPVRVRKF
ncbi:MAG: hypothetical protein SGARI_004857 [Bacillariaceae sp.]